MFGEIRQWFSNRKDTDFSLFVLAITSVALAGAVYHMISGRFLVGMILATPPIAFILLEQKRTSELRAYKCLELYNQSMRKMLDTFLNHASEVNEFLLEQRKSDLELGKDPNDLMILDQKIESVLNVRESLLKQAKNLHHEVVKTLDIKKSIDPIEE